MKIRPAEFPAEAIPPKARRVTTPREIKEEVKVALSRAARVLTQDSGDDRIDVERVERLREQIESGTYEIDEMALAQAILDKELRWKPHT